MATWPSKPYGWFSVEKSSIYLADFESASYPSATITGDGVIAPVSGSGDSNSYPDADLSVDGIEANTDSYSFLVNELLVTDIASDGDSYSVPEASISDMTVNANSLSLSFADGWTSLSGVTQVPLTFQAGAASSSVSVSGSKLAPVDISFATVGNIFYKIPDWSNKIEVIALGGGGGGTAGGLDVIIPNSGHGGGGAAGSWHVSELIKGDLMFTPGKTLRGRVGAGGEGTPAGGAITALNDGSFSGLLTARPNAGFGQSATTASGSGSLSWQHDHGGNDEIVFVFAAASVMLGSQPTLTATYGGKTMNEEGRFTGVSWGFGGTTVMYLTVFSYRLPLLSGTQSITVTSSEAGASHVLFGRSMSYENVAGFTLHKPTYNGTSFTECNQLKIGQGNLAVGIAATTSAAVPTWENAASEVGKITSSNSHLTVSEVAGLSVPGREQIQNFRVNHTGVLGSCSLVVLELQGVGSPGGGCGPGPNAVFQPVQWGFSPGNFTYNGVTYVGGVTPTSVPDSPGGVPGGGGSGSNGYGLFGTSNQGGSGGRGQVWLRVFPSPTTTARGETVLESPVDGWVHSEFGWGEQPQVVAALEPESE